MNVHRLGMFVRDKRAKREKNDEMEVHAKARS
jgi:hypothetical protein